MLLSEHRDNSSVLLYPKRGVLRLCDAPHVYALMGGGEWGPRALAKAVLESVYINPWNHVVIIDLAEAVLMHRTEGLDEVIYIEWYNMVYRLWAAC